ncbi:MAG: nicotinamide mononucleotide transporter [Pseudomonadales bacterium]|nr:nicotinamide mononucleotide transporter [Pseudomonadales bacterium]
MFSSVFDQLLASNLFELIGFISGLLCVWLLIRQSIWTWPIGLVYTLVSLFVFFEAKLYSEFGLHIYYAVMNAYGWYYWSRVGAAETGEGKTSVPVTSVNIKTLYLLIGITLVSIPALAALMSHFTDADMVYADATITILSFVAMWMTARKFIESWYVWLLVDVIATVVYVIKGIELYAVLYCVYIVMAVMGWAAWRKTLTKSALDIEQAAI